MSSKKDKKPAEELEQNAAQQPETQTGETAAAEETPNPLLEELEALKQERA